MKSLAGTYEFMAPEIILRDQYQSHGVDLFALGVILFVMRSREYPFERASKSNIIYNLIATG